MYYPKSQITTNLYTNGDTLEDINGEIYTGYYYKTSDERYFSGKNPNDFPTKELFVQGTNDDEIVADAEEGEIGSYDDVDSIYLFPPEYKDNINLNLPENAPSQPQPEIILPTEEDYELGEYQRYFLKRNNGQQYIEVSKETSKKFINKSITVLFRLYQPFSLPWLISGNRSDVFNINKNTVERVSENLRLIGFKSYWKNKYDQYYRYSPGENLKTDGTEFLLEKTGKPYIGLYHIHPDKGPMVGAQHVETPHDYLIPISGSNSQYRTNKVMTQLSNRTESTGYSGGY